MDTVRENNLDLITGALGTQGYVRIVGSADGKSYRMAIQDFMDLVAENPAVAELVTEEAEARQAADNEITLTVTNLQGALASEISARQAADTTLQGAISSEATARAAADTAIAQDVTELKADFENFEANGTSANAEALLSDDYVSESVPYLYRQTGGGIDGAGSREIDEIVGGSVVCNQLIGLDRLPSDSALYSNTTYTANGVTFTKNNDGSISVVTDAGGATSNTSVKIGTSTTLSSIMIHVHLVRCSGGSSSTAYINYLTSRSTTDKVYSPTEGGFNMWLRVDAGSTFTTPIKVYPQVIDLVALFGSAIADYIYSLEQSTAGAGVALFRKLFPDDYYAYNAGELMSVSGVSAHVMRDSDDNIIGNYPLDSSLTLRGIPKLDANNNIYYDGDIYAADGTVTRKYGVVDLGTLNWSLNADGRFMSATTDAKKPANSSTRANALCDKYLVLTGQQTSGGNNGLSVGIDGKIYVFDSSYADAATFKAAMSGVMFVYELATPTTETADPYTSPQICDKYGTEEYVTTGIVPVGHSTKYLADLKAKIEGLPWDLSMIAPIETGTKASQAYAVGKYFLLDNQLCKAKTAIASGATFTLNTNYEVTTVADELYTALHS